MTTFRKLIGEIDFNNTKLKITPDWEGLGRVFDLFNFIDSDDERLTAYFIKVHYCTDSYVGIRAYFLDGEFVALSHQVGRKYHEDFGFVSQEIAIKVKDYLRSLINDDATEYELLEGLDAEIKDTYKIEYNSQIMHKTALFDGESVEIIKTNYDSEGIDSPDYFHSVLIKKPNGVEEKVDCRDLEFKFNSLD
jgi:hypothetical protein